jgi:hypothetical protein
MTPAVFTDEVRVALAGRAVRNTPQAPTVRAAGPAGPVRGSPTQGIEKWAKPKRYK